MEKRSKKTSLARKAKASNKLGRQVGQIYIPPAPPAILAPPPAGGTKGMHTGGIVPLELPGKIRAIHSGG